MRGRKGRRVLEYRTRIGEVGFWDEAANIGSRNSYFSAQVFCSFLPRSVLAMLTVANGQALQIFSSPPASKEN